MQLFDLDYELARRVPLPRLVPSLDPVLAFFALLMLSPFLILIAVAIYMDSEGPVLFRQTRTGMNGQKFSIYKFRSMHVQENGAIVRQVTKVDPRVTRVGNFLRRTSLDELPQLLNVLRGEMALVGPRPHAVAHDVYYSRHISNYAQRFAVKPGLTGWAQINGSRGETPTLGHMERRIELDLWYVKRRSLALDLSIMARTVLAEVTRQTNAY
ncbi:exopolysaccharide biosynthesis polyprenyl glycosylphosphotransferase [Methylobacterium sp. 174MFSha1.1]|uniref:exopolysaccharide biosynthesis polyprenyl glycosylphosphotransferase n=1 Tax=Methylobacterium sp. 174MFSha1.1 TaxID=1502749 RepID=UPI001FCCF34B|nr:exopolysaccharide biosynthesis polyprenyl glycosylphosphotransferase [Methylobacterium sp. 174MFSha1.1]